MLRFFIISRSISSRFYTDYFLAKKSSDGGLNIAEFTRTDKKFCLSPRLSALVKINGQPGLCNISSVKYLIRSDVSGRVKNLQTNRQPWSGNIGPHGRDVEFLFYFHENKPLDFNDKKNIYNYDIVACLHDERRLMAVNILFGNSDQQDKYASRPTGNSQSQGKVISGRPGRA